MLKGKKAAILAANEFEDIEVWYPMIRLSEEEAWITLGILDTIGFHPRPYVPGKPVTGRFGTTIPPLVHKEGKLFDIRKIADMDPAEYDILVIPGGFSPDYLRRDPKTLDFVRKMNERKKPIAAICHGPWLMISAGIIKGKKVTGVLAVKDDLINAGGIFVDKEVIVDGNIITSRTPDDLTAFCKAIIGTAGSF